MKCSHFCRPGSDSYAYENPWPKLNKGRLDWLFQDGWRRPLASDQGGKLVRTRKAAPSSICIFALQRREWIWFGQVSYDEHKDWMRFHKLIFLSFTLATAWITFYFAMLKSDWCVFAFAPSVFRLANACLLNL